MKVDLDELEQLINEPDVPANVLIVACKFAFPSIIAELRAGRALRAADHNHGPETTVSNCEICHSHEAYDEATEATKGEG